MKTNQCALAMVLWAAWVGPLHALTYVTPEGSAALAIAQLSQSYAAAHRDALPMDWSDFHGMLNEPIEDVMHFAAPVKRYAFLSPSVEMAQPHAGELFAINRSDIFDSTCEEGFWGYHSGLQGPGRYGIYRTRDNQFLRVWLSAEEVRSLFAANHRSLPTEDHEPERVWVTKARNAMHARWVLNGVVLGGLIWLCLWKSGSLSRRRASVDRAKRPADSART